MNDPEKTGAQSDLNKTFLPPITRTATSQVHVEPLQHSSFNINNVFNGSEVYEGTSKKCDERPASSMTISEFINGSELNTFGNFISGTAVSSLPNSITSNSPPDATLPSDMMDALSTRVPFDHDLSELRAIIAPSTITDSSGHTVDQSNVYIKNNTKDFAVPSPIRHRVSPVKLEPLFTSTPDKITTMVVNSSATTQPLMVSRPDKLTQMAPPGQITDSLSHTPFLLSTNMRPTGTIPQSASPNTTLSDTLHSVQYPVVSQNGMYSGGKSGKKMMLESSKEAYCVDPLQLEERIVLEDDGLFGPATNANGESNQNLNFMSDAGVLSQLTGLNNDSQKEARSYRHVDLLLSQLQSSEDTELPNLGGSVSSDFGVTLQSSVSGQTLSNTIVDQLPPSPLLTAIPTDFLDTSASLPKSSPQQSNLHGLLPNLSTTTDLALTFSSQFLENSNMSIDMGSFSGSEASFTAPHSFAEVDSSAAKKTELNFTNALKGVTEKSFPGKSRSPLDDGKSGFLAPWKNDPRKRKSSDNVQESLTSSTVVLQVADATEGSVKEKKTSEEKPLVQQVSCFKCGVCSFLCLAKEDMAEHMKTKHSQEVVVPQVKSPNQERPPDEAKKKRKIEKPMVGEPSKKQAVEEAASTSRTRRPRKDNLKTKEESILIAQVDSVEDQSESTDSTNKRRNGRIQSIRKPEAPDKNGFKCGENGCTLKLKKKESLDYHRKCHVGAFLVCPECNTKFGPWSMLALHLWKAHGIDIELHKCQLCPYKAYSYTKMMNNHWKTHSEERSYLCDNCGKGFKTAKQLRSHKVLHSSKKVETRFNCEMCTRTFSDKRMLVFHLEVVHKKVKPYLCSFCGKSFASNSTLSLHTRKHTGEKPFACDNCNYRTADHNSMRRHKMKHDNAKRYNCPYCLYSSIQSSTYKVHLKRNHEELATRDGVLFCCSQCQFKTVKRDNYLSHMGTHHQISEEEQNRVANLQQETINNQLPIKRTSSSTTESSVIESFPLKQEDSPAAPIVEEPQQQTYYVVQMPQMVDMDGNEIQNGETSPEGDMVLIQMDPGHGMVQLTPEVVAVPIASNITPNNGGVIYLSNDAESIDIAGIKDET